MSPTLRSGKKKIYALRQKIIKNKKESKSLKKPKNQKVLKTKITAVQKKRVLTTPKIKLQEKKPSVKKEVECSTYEKDLKELKQLEKNLNKCKLNQQKPVKKLKYESEFAALDFKLKDHEILEDLIEMKKSQLLAHSKKDNDQ